MAFASPWNRMPHPRRLGPMRGWWLRCPIAIVALAIVVVACRPTDSSAQPSPPRATPVSPATTVPSATAGSPASPSAAGQESQAPALPPTACMSLVVPDCVRAAEAAVGAVGAGSPPPIYLQVGPFGCATGERCPATLAARPEGDVLVELPGVPAVTIHVTAAPDGSLRAVQGETFGIILPPASAPLGRQGPIPFTLGHCGIYSGIDVDGAWWDPVGPVDAENGDTVNAAEGTLAFTDPAHATFVSRGGLIVTLARRDGPKHLPFCD